MSKPRFEAAEARAVSHAEPDDLQYLMHHATLPDTRFSRVVDGALRALGRAMSWMWLALMLVIVLNVTMKNVFGDGRVEFEEIQWHIYSALFMLGLSVTLVNDEHVRVDLLYEHFSLRTKAWIEFFGIVGLLLPFAAMLFWYAVPFVVDAFETAERSASPAGLSHRWVIKSALLAGVGLLALAALARLHRVAALLFLGLAPNTRAQEV